jgi:hypothetical protein
MATRTRNRLFARKPATISPQSASRRRRIVGLTLADGSLLPPIEEMGEKIEALKESALRGMETLLTNRAGI